ncbi:MAG: DUF192 domain-containing protein [Elusimicrobia bacterium]|nr:DUF192 domain-containing protein [Elusimicrobiota bacterium]
MLCLNKTLNIVIAKNVRKAESFKGRLLGLMFKRFMAEGEGLLLTPCKAIHTCFMRFEIDAVFLDKDLRVVEVIKIKPWRLSPYVRGAVHTLELLSGAALPGKIRAGDEIKFV